MLFNNPLESPLFGPALRATLIVFGLGLALIALLARKDLRSALTGELGLRYLGWLILAPIYVLSVLSGGILALAILWGFILLGLREYSQIVGVMPHYRPFLYALSVLTLVIAGWWPVLFFALPAASILLLTSIPILTQRVEDLYNQLSYAGRGYLYLGWTLAHFLLLSHLPGGQGLLLLAGAGPALSDIGAYTVGKLLGRHTISPAVSPGKTYEGAFGNFVGAGVAVILFSFAVPPTWTSPHILGLVTLIGLGSAWGDLASSLAKRAAGAKDWGSLIPGHGGFLDRANSLVVVIPLVYYYAQLLEIFSPTGG